MKKTSPCLSLMHWVTHFPLKVLFQDPAEYKPLDFTDSNDHFKYCVVTMIQK